MFVKYIYNCGSAPHTNNESLSDFFPITLFREETSFIYVMHLLAICVLSHD